MIGFDETISVPAPPRHAFDQLADMAELARWNPTVVTSRRLRGEKFAVGSTYECTLRRGPLRMTALSELTRVEPGRSVTYEGTISGFWSVDTLIFEPDGSGTRITFLNQTRPPRWLRPFTPILNAAFQPQAHRAVEGARRYLENASS